MKKRSKGITCITMMTVFIAIPVFIFDHTYLSEPVSALSRNGYEEGDRKEMFRIVTDDGYEDDIEIDVKEKGYSDSELIDLSEKIEDVLWTKILGKNKDPENVMYDLDLADHIEGFPYKISWKSDKPLILGSTGRIDHKKLSEEDPDDEGISIRLCATLKYRDHTEDKYSYVVCRRKISYEDRLKEAIDVSINEAQDSSAEEDIMPLPETASGHKVRFYRKRINRGWAVLFTGIMAAVLFKVSKDNRAKEDEEKRKKQMETDHPKILNQYMLYYIAGMNPRMIWSAICKNYEDGLDPSGRNRRYAYDEMVAARNRMDEGYSELASYDEFARACDSIKYRSFISFVKQAVVAGNNGLSDQLYEEIDRARRDRCNMIKTRGSEAETRMLLPMFMMLLVVLVYVMVPALVGLY